LITAIALVAFWISVGLMFHSYVIYPALLKLLAAGKKDNVIVFNQGEADLPVVYVIFSAFNEEKVIAEKLESIFNTTYPPGNLKVYVGSDNSTDSTNDIINTWALKYPQLLFTPYYERNGKSNVLNRLVKKIGEENRLGDNSAFIFTDANVMFTPATIYELVKHFKNESIALVGANVQNRGMQKDGISVQESAYIQGENKVKYHEGLIWGSMMGAFGACYSMCASCWKEIPANYLMEDFYLSMNVLTGHKKAISEPMAICFEDVSNEAGEEFKRKSRIQAGNFQNLSVYWKLLFRFNAVSFCFFSHKLIRWMGPVFISASYISNIFLLPYSPFYTYTFVLQNFLLVTPVIDAVLKRSGVHLIPLRFASYFYMMNLALVNGFIMYARGVKTNAWSPTKRNV
jgi:cellulose synthase/poly-beta-1,6-N-acetylglucosamine synthase-like glycosyltransferase